MGGSCLIPRELQRRYTTSGCRELRMLSHSDWVDQQTKLTPRTPQHPYWSLTPSDWGAARAPGLRLARAPPLSLQRSC
uniref:Uncharacterized protein n=1 Tax=Torpedo marmorata TaxID=7788 RepID=Q9I985_TORMA|nr:hypothetical protein [Torpedo marmorata]